MTVSAHHALARKRSPEPATHMFGIGQMGRMKSRFGETPKTAEFYRVTGTLPPRDNSPQYRIRSDDGRHDRVATQDTLKPPAPSGPPRSEFIGADGRPSTSSAPPTSPDGQRIKMREA